jgi:hypothetical protein
VKLVDANLLLCAVDEGGDADFGRFAGLQWTNPLT